MIKEIKKNDRVTYDDGSVVIVYKVLENGLFTTKDDISSRASEIIKVERPHYTTVYERKEILDKKEKEYLSAVIKPFRNEVEFMIKVECSDNREYIRIYFKNKDNLAFQTFQKNRMYKGMQLYKKYTLKELDL